MNTLVFILAEKAIGLAQGGQMNPIDAVNFVVDRFVGSVRSADVLLDEMLTMGVWSVLNEPTIFIGPSKVPSHPWSCN